MFQLHPQLEKDSYTVTDLPLCRVLLMRDKAYPWLVLVPRRVGLRDFHDLEGADMEQAIREMRQASEALEKLFSPDKLNVAALGNMVPQLHIHVVARFTDDAAWPGPIWGVHPMQPYTAAEAEERIAAIRAAL